ncbi:kinase-like protein, partial [Hortaea werneckii]
FLSHLSGFVYKVHAGGRTVIKKEVPGPDTVDEFLYEVNALDSLRGCESIIQLEGLVTNDSGDAVKGLLISYAPGGALVDILYDYNGGLPWYRREKWAKQIVQGLSDIHEAGFVQGDFTLSNIVIDEYDNAQIIDINRRGCPVGWEPPELSRLIDSGQRISMCISVKTDLFQLGMVLWALAEQIDEPERVERPLPRLIDGVPAYYSEMVEICLSERPQSRWPANRLLRMFPHRRHSPVSFQPPPDRHSPIPFQPHPDRRPASPDPFDNDGPDPADL